jgi:hypothetical protein
MIELLENLVRALRDELQEYGEMLARLDQQQDAILQRSAEAVVNYSDSVRQQGETILSARQKREASQRRLARHLTMPEDTGFGAMSRRMPSDYQLLIRALVEENNELLVRVQQRARQNHLLLRRAVELMQNMLRNLAGEERVSTYTEEGAPLLPALAGPVLYEAAG